MTLCCRFETMQQRIQNFSQVTSLYYTTSLRVGVWFCAWSWSPEY